MLTGILFPSVTGVSLPPPHDEIDLGECHSCPNEFFLGVCLALKCYARRYADIASRCNFCQRWGLHPFEEFVAPQVAI